MFRLSLINGTTLLERDHFKKEKLKKLNIRNKRETTPLIKEMPSSIYHKLT